MRFKFFGNKGSLDTTITNTKKKKEKKKPKEETAIVCTGYRRNNEFDIPAKMRSFPSQTYLNDEASSSQSFKQLNGQISTPYSSYSKSLENIEPSEPLFSKMPTPHSSHSKLQENSESSTAPVPFQLQPPPRGILVKATPPQQTKSTENLTKITLNDSDIDILKPPDSPEIVLRRKPNPSESQKYNSYKEDDQDDEVMYQKQTISTVHKKTEKETKEDEKKSTLIHMTESHDHRQDDDGDYYENIDRYVEREDNHATGSNNRSTRDEYSSEAASIFFNTSSDTEEPVLQRKRNIKYKDDEDDNGSQTSA